MNSNVTGIFRTPLRIIVTVGLVVLAGEFAIMLVIEGVLHSAFPGVKPRYFWEFLDALLLSAIVAPVLYFGIFRSMKGQSQTIDQQRERLSAIFDTLTEGVALNEMVFDDAGEMVDYRVLEVNKAFYTTADYVADGPVIGQSATELYSMDAATINAFWKEHKNANEPVSVEMLSPISHKWFSITTSPFINNRFVTSFQDITERKQSENALRASEEKLRGLYELAPVGIALTDMQGHYVEFNQAFANICGYPAKELKTLDYWTLTPKKYAADEARQLESLDRTGVYGPYEKEYIRKDGSLVPLELNGMLITGSDNRKYIWSIVQDITERRQKDRQLRQWSDSFNHAALGIALGDVTTQRILVGNLAFARMLGLTADEMTGYPILDAYAPSEHAKVQEVIAEAARSGGAQFESRMVRKDGAEFPVQIDLAVIKDAEGKPLYRVATIQDITEKKRAEERIERLAHFDQLTDLPNRTLLNDHFVYALSLAQRSGEQLTVMFLDLDHFKNINDTLGHSIGDQLLIEIAKRLKAALRAEDTLSRQGGDEFIMILPGTDMDGAAHVAEKIIEAVAQPCLIENHELTVTPSIGIAVYPDDGENMESLSRNADTAMYRAKQNGRNNFCFFTPEMQAQSARNLRLANALRHALARNEFLLHYQPQLSIQDGHIVGVEALLRWNSPEFGLVSPAEFIPIAEDSGLIIPIGEWVLRTAAAQLKSWIGRGLPQMMMAVNLSAVQFRQQGLTEMVTRILAEVGLPPECLELELTEAATMENPESAIAVMNQLHEQGIRMSIDDFGTGYSSLSYLKQFNVYKLKIDQSFVRDITDDPEDKAIVTAIINMASSLGLQTIAEGVETASQLAFLRLQGCDEVQGFYFSRPLAAEPFEEFARKHATAPPISG